MQNRWRARSLGVAGAAALLGVSLLFADAGRVRGPGLNVRINAPQLPSPNGLLGRSGEAVAADDPGDHLVAAWENVQGFCGPPVGKPCSPPAQPGLTNFGWSSDGGRTWTDGGAPFVVDHGITGGHPWLDRGGGDNRTFFLVSRGWDATDLKSLQRGITFHRGRFQDRDFTWQDGRLLVPPRPGDAWRGPSVAAAKDGSGRVFVALTNLRSICGSPGIGFGQIEVLRSADGGATWGKPIVVGPEESAETADPKDPRCVTSGNGQVAPALALGPGKATYLVWQFGPYLSNVIANSPLFDTTLTVSVRFSRSLDGGVSWSPPRDLVALNSVREDPPVGYSGDTVNDIPRIAVATAGPHRGRIYVTYASAVGEAGSPAATQCLVSTQVYLISSDDQGLTWSAPVPLAPPVPPAAVKRFWPTVAVGSDGDVDVIYAESQERQVTADPEDLECRTVLINGQFRSGRVSSLVDLYRAHSGNGGMTFEPPVRITSETANWCTTFYDAPGRLFANFGDYLGVFASRRRLFAVWTDGRSGVPEAYFTALSPAGRRRRGAR